MLHGANRLYVVGAMECAALPGKSNLHRRSHNHDTCASDTPMLNFCRVGSKYFFFRTLVFLVQTPIHPREPYTAHFDAIHGLTPLAQIPSNRAASTESYIHRRRNLASAAICLHSASPIFMGVTAILRRRRDCSNFQFAVHTVA